jgi:hypothetical protein
LAPFGGLFGAFMDKYNLDIWIPVIAVLAAPLTPFIIVIFS